MPIMDSNHEELEHATRKMLARALPQLCLWCPGSACSRYRSAVNLLEVLTADEESCQDCAVESTLEACSESCLFYPGDEPPL